MARRVSRPAEHPIEVRIMIAETVIEQHKGVLKRDQKALERLRERPEMAGEWGWPSSLEAAQEAVDFVRQLLIEAEEKLAGLRQRQKEGAQ